MPGAGADAGLKLSWRRRRRQTPPAARPGGISIIVPVIDEERRIGQRLKELRGTPDVAEVIVVDGGSRDRTLEIVRGCPGVRLLAALRGRGVQMNAGARAASGDVLLFLHADVSLPPDATACVARALAAPEVVAGAFRTWTVDDAGRSCLTPLLHLADLRSRVARLPYGDQAVFVRREAFVRVGGFPDQPLMEDLELARRLRRIGRIVVVPAVVRVSGRRFLAHPLSAILTMRLFPLLYRLGVSARVLDRLYGRPR
ncbi:MAG: TIGR04283 family arsenosugar biosynthesis glycosyltransferase [Candidatus Binatia bacterium]